MKYFFAFLFLYFSVTQPNDLTEEVLKQEILRNSDKFTAMGVGDSILIHKTVMQLRPLRDYYNFAIAEEYMTEKEACNIFGQSSYDDNINDKTNWEYNDFPGLKVALFDREKYTNAYASKNSKKIGVGTFDIRAISKPMIMRSKLYAIIAWSSQHYGPNISIYRSERGKWIFYKGFAYM